MVCIIINHFSTDHEKVLYINANGGREKDDKTLLTLELEELFDNYENVTFETMCQKDIEKIHLQTKYKNHQHLIIDEYNMFVEYRMKPQLSKAVEIFSALAVNFKSVWICLANERWRDYSFDEKDFLRNFQSYMKSELGFIVPQLQYPLRGNAKIVEFVKCQSKSFVEQQKRNDETIRELTRLDNSGESSLWAYPSENAGQNNP